VFDYGQFPSDLLGFSTDLEYDTMDGISILSSVRGRGYLINHEDKAAFITRTLPLMRCA
jgi:hypothetical protein